MTLSANADRWIGHEMKIRNRKAVLAGAGVALVLQAGCLTPFEV